MKRIGVTKRIGRWAANLTLLGFGCAFGLVFAELAVRLIAPQSVLLWRPGPFEQDGAGFFRLRPGHRGRVTNRIEYDTEVRINTAGLRGAELTHFSEENTCLALAVGDSFTFGLGVEEDQVFHQLAAQRLRQRAFAIEIVNGGIPAIGVPQEVRWLERHGLVVEPDLVLLTVFVGNDLRDANIDYDNWKVIDGLLAPPGARKGLKDWLYEHLHLFVLGKATISTGLQRQLRARLGMEEPWSLRYAREVFMIYHRTPPLLVREGLERTEKALDALLSLAARHHFRVAATLIPDIVQIDNERWKTALEQLGLEPGQYDSLQPNRMLRAAFEQRGIPVLDLLAELEAGVKRGEQLNFPIDQHWNRDGHELAGKELALFLQGLIPECSQEPSATS